MSKVLKTVAKVATVVAAVAAVATTFGAALPAIAIGAGTVSIATAASTIAMVAGTVGSLTAKKPKAVGTTNQFALDPQAGIPYAIGRTFIGGRLVHVEGYGGTTNPYRSSVIAFGFGGPYEQIESVLIDRTPVTFSGGAATGYYSGFMWFASQLGATPEASALPSPFAGFPNWTSAHKLSGYCAGIWTVKFDTKGKVFASGTPEFGIVAKAAKVYDPRLDSTFPGGSGPCRATVESTYVWSENGILHGLTWALGRWQNGKRALGVGINITDIDVQAFVDAANNADANGWKAGALLDASGDKKAILDTMLQAGGAESIDLGGLLSLRFDAPKVSLATLTGDDLADGEIKVPAMKTWRDRINGVIPRYRSEAHNWEIIPASAVRGSTYEAEDGEQRTREFEFYCVQNVTQAAQHAGYLIANSREIDGIEIPLKIRAIGYKPGDCVTVNLPEAGLTNQPVVITNRAINPVTGTVMITCRTETAAKHAFALGRTASPPPSATISGSADIDALVWNNRTTAGQLVFRHPEARPTEPPINSIYIDATGRQSIFQGRALTIAGDPVLIGGDPVYMSGWVDAQDQAIGTAQGTADAAAATAAAALAEAQAAASALSVIDDDNIIDVSEKVSVLIPKAAVLQASYDALTAAATAQGVSTTAAASARTGWLAQLAALLPAWNDVSAPSPVIRSTYQAALDAYEAALAALNTATADLTSAAVPSLSGVPGSVPLSADFTGTITSGILPININAVRKRGNADVSASTTWSIVDVSGLQGGSAAISVDANGIVTIPSGLLIGATAEFKVRSLRDGVTLDSLPVKITKTNAPPPATGGGGSGTTATDSTFGSVSGTSMTAISDILTVKTGSGGQISFSAPLTTIAAAAAPAGVFDVALIWRWRAIGGSFADVGTETASDPDCEVILESGIYYREDGSVNCAGTKTGLAASTDYEVQLFARRTTSSPSKAITFAGTASATGS